MAFYQEPLRYQQIGTPFSPVAEPEVIHEQGLPQLDTINRRMLLALAFATFFGLFLYSAGPTPSLNDVGSNAGEAAPENVVPAAAVAAVGGALAPIFSPEVMHWEPNILAWAAEAGVDPNLAAIIMQVESCGDPQAISSAGAQGLFQVMPFHFEPGENSLDPDTNARRGLAYFADRLTQTNGDIGRAFAGYNGGHVAADGNWDSWAAETQRYFTWTSGLYADVMAGTEASPMLAQWMSAGGASLCRQAAARLGLS
jgi:soluble lytic murein transglycosylase-like protein